MKCEFCGHETDKYIDPYPKVCESCYDQINMEEPFGGVWINYEGWSEFQKKQNKEEEEGN